MKIISLKKLVEDNDINIVEVEVGEGVSPVSFEVGSPDYREQETYLVKGNYDISKQEVTGKNVLRVERLEEGLNISLNAPVIIADDVTPEEEAKLEEFVNTPITAVVFNRQTLQNASRHTKRRFVTAYAQSVVESFRKTFGEAELGDFAVIEIDWENRQLALKSLSDKVESTES